MHWRKTWREAFTAHFREHGAPPVTDLEAYRRGFKCGYLDAGLDYAGDYSRHGDKPYNKGYRAGLRSREY